MEKFIPVEKISKKKQRELTAQKRGTWGGQNPATRKPENPKAYNRKKARKWNQDSMTVPSVFVGMIADTWYNLVERWRSLRALSFRYARALISCSASL
ncbi:MAG: hypothetical protein ACOX7I_00820 [Oscillospiraceae bacterium]|jgi:hypothetical protein